MKKKKVLILEDEQSLSKILVEKFELEGYLVKAAYNGFEGLTAVKDFKPDLILLDIIMPEMDGFTFLKKLRKMEGSKKTPVIVLTNLSEPPKNGRWAQEEVLGYLVKTDWSLDQLVEIVNKKIN
jgi:CheY-like chemotaxis protein